MKLNLGCGKRKMKGYLGVDLNPDVKPDIVDHMILLKTIKPNSVDEIKSQSSFEHITYADAIKALKRWHEVLKPGGILSIEFPDFVKSFKMTQSKNPVERKYGWFGVYGDAKNLFLMHKHGWTLKTITKELQKVGFKKIWTADLERKNKCQLFGFDRDIRVVAKK